MQSMISPSGLYEINQEHKNQADEINPFLQKDGNKKVCTCNLLYLNGHDSRLVDLVQVLLNPPKSQATDLSILGVVQLQSNMTFRSFQENEKEESQKKRRRRRRRRCCLPFQKTTHISFNAKEREKEKESEGTRRPLVAKTKKVG